MKGDYELVKRMVAEVPQPYQAAQWRLDATASLERLNNELNEAKRGLEAAVLVERERCARIAESMAPVEYKADNGFTIESVWRTQKAITAAIREGK